MIWNARHFRSIRAKVNPWCVVLMDIFGCGLQCVSIPAITNKTEAGQWISGTLKYCQGFRFSFSSYLGNHQEQHTAWWALSLQSDRTSWEGYDHLVDQDSWKKNAQKSQNWTLSPQEYTFTIFNTKTSCIICYCYQTNSITTIIS